MMHSIFLAVDGVDFSAITTALSDSINAGQVSSIIAAIFGSTVGIAVLWWRARKLVHAVVTTFKTGKIRF